MHVVIDSMRAHADHPQNVVVEYRVWRSAAEKDAGLPPIKQDTHTQQLPPRRIEPVIVNGMAVLANGTQVDPKDLPTGETTIRARVRTPDYAAFLRSVVERKVKDAVGDARDRTIPLIADDAEGALSRGARAAMEGVAFDV